MAYWAVAQLETHRERVAEYFLKQFGFEAYLPWTRRYAIRFRRRIAYRMPYFPGYAFVRIQLQWHDVHKCPGVLRLIRIGADEPVHVPDAVIDALRAKERDGAIDLPNEKRGRRVPRLGDRVQITIGPFAGQSGLCTQISRQQVGVLLLMFGTQRQVRLARDAVSLA